MKWAVFLMFIVLLTTTVAAYQTGYPVKIEDDYFSEYDKKIIEGRDITNEEGDCIYIKGSEWVVIRNNYIHDCKPIGKNSYKGYAIYIEDVDNLIIEGNLLENNFRGIYLKNVNHVIIRENNQTGTYRDAVFKIEGSDDIKIHDNYAENNGVTDVMLPATPAYTGQGDGRLQGIVLWRTSNAEIYSNTIINSSSDGIGIAGGTKEDPHFRSHNFKIYDNTLLENGEQGIWIEAAQDGEIYGNHIARNKARTPEHGGSSGIMFQFDVRNFEVHDNLIEDNDVCGVLLQNSPENFIYSNTIKGNFDGGVCLDGETVSLEEYWHVGNNENKIHRNIFKNNELGNIVIWSGGNDETEIFYNNFDTVEDDSIVSKDKQSLKDELLLTDNLYKEEPIEEELVDDVVESSDEQEETPEEIDMGQAEEIITPPEDNPLLAYSLLTLFFVLIVVGIILLSVRKSKK